MIVIEDDDDYDHDGHGDDYDDEMMAMTILMIM